MNAVLHENPLERYEAVYTGKKTIEISGETVVPDKMPDIGLLGDTNAHVLLRAKQTESGRGLMEGELAVSVCFVPDGASGFRMLTMELPWQTEFESENITDGSTAVGAMRVMQLETRMLNPRKILVKAKLCGELTVYEKQETAVCDGAEGDETIQVCRETLECSVVSTICERTFAATDEYPLPPDLVGGEIIGKSVQFRVEDVKTLTNKLIVKGTVLSDVVIASESGEAEKISFTTGFSFIAETDCEQVSDDVCICIMPTAMYYEPASGGRVLSMEVHGVCQMTVYAKRMVAYLSDAYSNFYPCECSYDALTVFTDMKTGMQRENISGSIACRSQVARVRFLTASHTVTNTGENTQVTVQVGACVQYENGMTDWVKKQVTVPIKRKPTERVTAVRLGDLYGVCSGAELEYRMTVDYELREENVCRIRLLSSASYNEEQPMETERPSLMVVRSGGKLWELARRHGSTVSLIQTYNGIEDEEAASNTLLLIPRQRK